MQVKILHAESLRFPGEGKSAQGKSEANTRPKGVVDAQQVNIPAPAAKVEPVCVTGQGRSPDRLWGLGRTQVRITRTFCFRSLWRRVREKHTGDDADARTKTDTGRRGEYPKALERTVVKELGKITP